MNYSSKIRLLTLGLTSLLAVACNGDTEDTSDADDTSAVEDSGTADTDTDVDTYTFGDAPAASVFATGSVEVITEDTVRYHVLVAAGFTSTLVESETGVTLVDVGPNLAFIENMGVDLRAYADAIGKPLSVIITHAHGDHYNNIDQFNDLEVFAETSVAAQLMASDGFTGLYTDTVTAAASTQEIGGLSFSFDVISGAETGENGYVYLEAEKALFAEDLLYNKLHNYIREYTPLDGTDEIDAWIAGIDGFKTDFGDYNHVFVGHGGTRTDISAIVDENIDYLTTASGLINGSIEITGGGYATSNAEVVTEIQALYSEYPQGAEVLSLADAFFPGDQGASWFE